MNKSILLIDDDERLSHLLADLFDLDGYAVTIAQTGKEGLELAQKSAFAVAIADVHLPDTHGIELVRLLKEVAPATEVIVLTAHAEVKDGVEAMKNGAFDYALKTGDHEQLMLTIARAAEKSQLQLAVKELQKQLVSQDAFGTIIGVAPALQEAVKMARHAAHTDIPTLLLGETGTGKEVFARAVHNSSTRVKKAFVALNCSAIPADLLESELFGYQKGAFSGAVRDKRGLIEEAHEGTLFLDEIGEMPLALQSKLLRVLETRKFARVGSTELIDVDFRIIAATNANPQEEIASGRFRADLYYRLEGFTIVLPALRDRRGDIEILAQYFLTMFAAKYQKNVLSMSPEFIRAINARRWKGNVRELRNSMERAIVLCSGTVLSPDLLSPELEDLQFQSHLPQAVYNVGYPAQVGIPNGLPMQPYPVAYPAMGFPNYAGQYPAGTPSAYIPNGMPNGNPMANPNGNGYNAPYPQQPYQTYIPNGAASENGSTSDEQSDDAQFSLRRAEDERARQEIIAALQASGGHREKTAKLLGISPATLYRKLQKYGIA
ncbi:MAG: sigma-54 dependent transcriptional regulator [Candidatus Kapabacteria bacterium]|nr:sigma-54 dependent transcriptional regulator [Candidatus Kapabacteria bacterium]